MPSPGGKGDREAVDEECGRESNLTINVSDLFGTIVSKAKIRKKIGRNNSP